MARYFILFAFLAHIATGTVCPSRLSTEADDQFQHPKVVTKSQIVEILVSKNRSASFSLETTGIDRDYLELRTSIAGEMFEADQALSSLKGKIQTLVFQAVISNDSLTKWQEGQPLQSKKPVIRIRNAGGLSFRVSVPGDLQFEAHFESQRKVHRRTMIAFIATGSTIAALTVTALVTWLVVKYRKGESDGENHMPWRDSRGFPEPQPTLSKIFSGDRPR